MMSTSLRHGKRRRAAQIRRVFRDRRRAIYREAPIVGPAGTLDAMRKLDSEIRTALRARGLLTE